MQETHLNLKVLLPFHVFVNRSDVTKIVAESTGGSFGILPHRLDCVAALRPGILIYVTESGDEAFVAVDDGVLVKAGLDVLISVRRAIAGSELGKLREAVEREFKSQDQLEQSARLITKKLEAGFLRRFAELKDE